MIGNHSSNDAAVLRYHPARRHRHHPAGLRAARFQAVEISLGPVASAVVLDSERGDLPIDRLGHLALGPLDLGALLGRGANDVESPPGQHAGDGIKVRGIDIAPQPRGLEGDGTPATEGIADLRPMPEAQDAELLDQLLMRVGINAEAAQMGVYGGPDRRVESSLILLLRTLAEPGALLVGGEGRECAGQQIQLVGRVDVAPPTQGETGVVIRIERALDVVDLLRVRGIALEGGAEVAPGILQGDPPRDVGRAELRLTPSESDGVESHQLLEDLQVLLGIIRPGQQAAEQDGPHQDERFAALPVGAERGQGLPGTGLALALCLERDLLRRKDRLDQRRGVSQRERLEPRFSDCCMGACFNHHRGANPKVRRVF